MKLPPEVTAIDNMTIKIYKQEQIIADLLEALKRIVKEFHNPFASPQASSNTMRMIAEQAIRKAEKSKHETDASIEPTPS